MTMTENDVLKHVSFADRKKKSYDRPNINIYPLTEKALAYLYGRGLSDETIKAYKLGCDERGDIIFPFYRDSELVFVKYRHPYTTEDGPKEWAIQNTEPILFGMDNVSYNKPLYITEGMIDALSLYEVGITNVVSVPSGCNNLNWIELCFDWLDRFDNIVLFGDADDPGIGMVNNIIRRLGEDKCKLPPEYPDMLDENGVPSGKICKDANEILMNRGVEALLELAEQCKPAPIKGVVNLAEVEFVDPASIPRVYTRIPSLDKLIGGFSAGQVITISGKRGEGKSTVSGLWMLNAIEQGHKVCALTTRVAQVISNDY